MELVGIIIRILMKENYCKYLLQKVNFKDCSVLYIQCEGEIVNQEQIKSNTDNIKTNNSTVTSPLSAKKLVSKVNALIHGNRSNSLTNPQAKSFSTEKAKTLDYKNVFDDINKLYPVHNLYEFYS